ncbi:MAG: TRAP transporter small permease [Tissierellia bacterium]|nr:TRAP transporter small permease [Tissierellia bacterium]
MFKKIEGIIEKIEEWVVSLSVIIMAILMVVSVFMRTVLNHSLTFSEEIGQLLLIIVSFFGIGYCVRRSRHVNMSMVFDAANKKGKKAMMYIVSLISAVLMIILFVLSIQYIMSVAKLGRTSPALNIPMAWFYISLPIGFLIAAIEYIRIFIANLRHKDQVYISSEVSLEEGPPTEEKPEIKEA